MREKKKQCKRLVKPDKGFERSGNPALSNAVEFNSNQSFSRLFNGFIIRILLLNIRLE